MRRKVAGKVGRGEREGSREGKNEDERVMREMWAVTLFSMRKTKVE